MEILGAISFNKIIMIVTVILFSVWMNSINYRIFDKKLKKYMLTMGGLLVIFICERIVKLYIQSNLIWYLYYFPLIFIPTIYYLCSKFFLGKNSTKNKLAIYLVSTVLLILVLTNDIHRCVFSDFYGNGDYTYRWGYWGIVAWIFYLLIGSTVNLVLKKMKYKQDIRLIVPFIPIILGIIYTLSYSLEIPSIIRHTNMNVVISFLFFIGVEGILQINLIPSNVKYEKIFKNSYLPIEIVSNNGDIIYETKKYINKPQIITRDIKNNNVQKKYYNGKNKNQVFEITRLNNSYAILKKDYSNIEKLKEELELRSKELLRQEKFLNNQKKIKDKLLEIKISNEILDALEDKIEEKKERIEFIIDNMEKPNKAELEEVKMLIAYCKRMSNLIISNYNNNTYNQDKIRIMLNELMEDSEMYGIYGMINIKENIEISSIKASNIYEIIFTLFQNIRDTGVLINVNESSISILLDKKATNIGKLIKNNLKDIIEKISEKSDIDETLLVITI